MTELGAQVRKGERSTTVVFWKFLDEDGESETPDADEEKQTKQQRRCIAHAYHVFNSAQVGGYTLPAVRHMSNSERIAARRRFCFANFSNRETWR